MEHKGAMEKHNPKVFVRVFRDHNFYKPSTSLSMEKALDLIGKHTHFLVEIDKPYMVNS